ncbi:hypothetical protein ACIBCT_22655 [Streptosporangium sp. NPDC050855]
MAVKPPGPRPRKLSVGHLLLAAIIAWIVLLTVIILLDPAASAPVH